MRLRVFLRLVLCCVSALLCAGDFVHEPLEVSEDDGHVFVAERLWWVGRAAVPLSQAG